MEYISTFTSAAKPLVNPLAQRIGVPRGNGMSTVDQMPIPQSGMDRAEWWAAAVNGLTHGVSRDQPILCSYDRGNVFGANERSFMGNTREDVVGAMAAARKTEFLWDDETTKNSDAMADAYTVQVSSTNGFWDGEQDKVWVTPDYTSVWF